MKLKCIKKLSHVNNSGWNEADELQWGIATLSWAEAKLQELNSSFAESCSSPLVRQAAPGSSVLQASWLHAHSPTSAVPLSLRGREWPGSVVVGSCVR